jgi:hypothetical protein
VFDCTRQTPSKACPERKSKGICPENIPHRQSRTAKACHEPQAKDPRLPFHGSGWNTIPCPTRLPFKAAKIGTVSIETRIDDKV